MKSALLTQRLKNIVSFECLQCKFHFIHRTFGAFVSTRRKIANERHVLAGSVLFSFIRIINESFKVQQQPNVDDIYFSYKRIIANNISLLVVNFGSREGSYELDIFHSLVFNSNRIERRHRCVTTQFKIIQTEHCNTCKYDSFEQFRNVHRFL